MRFETFQALGHSIQIIPRTPPSGAPVRRLVGRVLWKLGYPLDWGLNEAILNSASPDRADVLWCERPLDVKPDTLEEVRKLNPTIKVVAYSLDDMAQSHNQSAYYLRSIPFYDLHVTTKSYNVLELKSLGARKVLFVNNAFCPFVHFPMEPTSEQKLRYGGAVGFIGTYERERAEMLVTLAKEGIPVRVWGSNWPNRLRSASGNLRIEGKCLFGASYRIALNTFDINLCFLRKINRDLQTTRSVEIPACGAFMLAERTEEHRVLFEEGCEAAYFSSTEEFIQKVRFYLQNDSLRKAIAQNGFRKASAVPYTYDAQLERILEQL
jgi:hypothetical protein